MIDLEYYPKHDVMERLECDYLREDETGVE